MKEFSCIDDFNFAHVICCLAFRWEMQKAQWWGGESTCLLLILVANKCLYNPRIRFGLLINVHLCWVQISDCLLWCLCTLGLLGFFLLMISCMLLNVTNSPPKSNKLPLLLLQKCCLNWLKAHLITNLCLCYWKVEKMNSNHSSTKTFHLIKLDFFFPSNGSIWHP
jgi:hypothetical protein